VTCEEKIKALTDAGDEMAALLSGLPETERWAATKKKVTEPPSAPDDPLEEWGS
jgi:hypothetical protein